MRVVGAGGPMPPDASSARDGPPRLGSRRLLWCGWLWHEVGLLELASGGRLRVGPGPAPLAAASAGLGPKGFARRFCVVGDGALELYAPRRRTRRPLAARGR